MKRLFLALALLFSGTHAVDTLSVPTDFNTIPTGTRANLSGNFSAIQTWGNKVRDTLAPVTARLSGYTGTMTLSSLSHLRLRLDADNSETGRLSVESGNGDSLFRVSEDSSAKFFGPVTLPSPVITGTLALTGRTTLTDSLIGASQRLSGNLAAVNGSFSGTLGVTGITTLSGDLVFNGAATGGTSRIYKSSVDGIGIRGVTGSSNDLSLLSAAGTIIIKNPTGTTQVSFPGSGGISVTAASTFTSTVTADSIISPKFYDEGTFTFTYTGGSTSPTGTGRYVRIGKSVTLFIPNISATSNSGTFTFVGLPASIQTARQVYFKVPRAQDNGVSIVTAEGTITAGSSTVNFLTTGGGGWTASGTKSIEIGFCIQYTLQ